jgi:hypothetical protein
MVEIRGYINVDEDPMLEYNVRCRKCLQHQVTRGHRTYEHENKDPSQ